MWDIATTLPWLLPVSAVALAVSVAASGVVGRWLRIHRLLAVLLVTSLGVVLAGTLSPLATPDVVPPGTPRTCDLTRTWLATPMDLAMGNDVVVNILMLMPLGFAIGAVPFSARKVALILAGIALPFVIEWLQLVVVVLGRGCQAADVVDNLTGLFIGLLAGVPFSLLQAPVRRAPNGQPVER
jgi:hypothetical protein